MIDVELRDAVNILLSDDNKRAMPSSTLRQFVNCRILRNHKIITEDLWVRNGKIVNPEKIFFDEKIKADVVVDCKNAIIAPGFIDLQINGGYGYDFSNPEHAIEGVDVVAKHLLSHGVTSFCPTLVTSPKSIYHAILPKLTARQGDVNGATILGVHLEGPFINAEKKGAHPSQYIIPLEHGYKTLAEVYGCIDNVKLITVAPELENCCETIENLTSRGIVVSVGHSMADLKTGEEAVGYGASFITHLFNAMLPFHHRDPGLVGLLTSDRIPKGRKIFYGIIADGTHTHPAALRIAYRAHPDGLVLVTDALSPLGLQEGRHSIGQFQVEIRDNKAFIAGTNTLCGSIATMEECVQTFKEATGCTTEYALETASLHPAEVLGITDKKGTLNFDSDADFLLLNDDLHVLQTWINGECVYDCLRK